MQISFRRGEEGAKVRERSRARDESLGELEEVNGSLIFMQERKAVFLYIES